MLGFIDFMPWPWPELFGRSGSNKDPQVVFFPDAARPRHSSLSGGTGAGKTRFYESLLAIDVSRLVTGTSSRGISLIEVHGDFFRNAKSRLALLAMEYSRLYELVHIIDPTNQRWTIRYNPLELETDELPEDRAGMLADVITTIYHDDPTVVNRMRWLLFHAFLTLILTKRSLLVFPRLLRDREFREYLVNSLGHHELSDYWLREFPKSDKDAMAWAESSLDRLGPFVTDPRIGPMLEGSSTINLRRFLDEGAIALINAPKGKLGEGKAYLFCALLLAGFQSAAMSRIDLPDEHRTPLTLICDEYQNYTTDTIRQIVTESRKVGLELMLATQEVVGSPKDEQLRRTIRKVAGNIFSFRLDREDAEILVKDLFTPEIDQVKDWSNGKATYRSMGEIWEQEIRKLTNLPDRMLWWKRRGHPESHLIQTFTVRDLEDMPNYHLLPEALRRQDFAAFQLSGRPRRSLSVKMLPEPRHDVSKGIARETDHSFWVG